MLSRLQGRTNPNQLAGCSRFQSNYNHSTRYFPCFAAYLVCSDALQTDRCCSASCCESWEVCSCCLGQTWYSECLLRRRCIDPYFLIFSTSSEVTRALAQKNSWHSALGICPREDNHSTQAENACPSWSLPNDFVAQHTYFIH